MIKAGYMLNVKSWDNDGDNRNTVMLDGLSLDLVTFYIRFLQLFKNSGLGNSHEPTERLMEDLKQKTKILASEFPFAFPEMEWGPYHEDIICVDALSELTDALLGCSENYYFRVYDGHVVYKIKEAIYPETIN